MEKEMQSVVISSKLDGSWQALHVPSKRVTHGLSKDEAELAMRELLGLNAAGAFEHPLTSPEYSGLAREVAEFLERDVSSMLAFHSGYARLEAFADGIATIRLGGGCQGCPSSQLTLFSGVKKELQARFGETAVVDVQLASDF